MNLAERVEWAEQWPDGKVLPVHPNYSVIGKPTGPAPHAHRGTVWVKRTVTCSEWEVWSP